MNSLESGALGNKQTAKPPPVDYLQVAPLTPGTVSFHVLGASLEGGLLILIVIWLVWHAELAPGPVGIGLALLVGTFLADLVSGLLHWAFDCWFDQYHPLLRRMVLMVREHHIYPQRIFKFPFYNDVGVLAWIVLLVTGPWAAVVMLDFVPGGPFSWACLCSMVVFSLEVIFMLEFHKLGHRSRVGPAIRCLQRLGLVLQHGHHVQHHIANHDINYCLINGWADITLGRLGLFRWLERLIHRMTGAVPQQNDHEWLRRYGHASPPVDPPAEPSCEEPARSSVQPGHSSVEHKFEYGRIRR